MGPRFGESKNDLYLKDKSATFFYKGPISRNGVVKSLMGLSRVGDLLGRRGEPPPILSSGEK